MPSGNSVKTKIPSGWLTVSEVAKYADVHPDTIRSWTDVGLLKCTRRKVGKLSVRMYRESEADKALRLGRSRKYLRGRARVVGVAPTGNGLIKKPKK